MYTAIVTGASAAHFSLLLDLIHNLRTFKQAREIPICVLDVGLEPTQRAALAGLAERIVTPGWDLSFPGMEAQPGWYRAMVSRPFLPKHFPGYDHYVWLDADLWLQDWRAIELLTLGSRAGKIAIVPELHRLYGTCFHLDEQRASHLRMAFGKLFGEELGARYAIKPVLNSGVFALLRDAPHWEAWARALADGLQRFPGWLTEQCCLNAELYECRLPFHFLPAWCNWNCALGPLIYDLRTRTFCEYSLPNERVSILHLTDTKFKTTELQLSDGRQIECSLHYSDVMKNELLGHGGVRPS